MSSPANLKATATGRLQALPDVQADRTEYGRQPLMHWRIRLTAGALTLALLSACASTQGLAPHERTTSGGDLAAETTLAQARLTAGQWPAPDWWKRFGDPQLDHLEQEALAGNPTLRMAQARIAKAQAAAGITGSVLSPQLDARAQGTRQRYSEHDAVPPPLAGSWRTQSRVALDFGYEFDFWGKNRTAFAAATSRVQAATVDAFAARLLLSVTVASDYVQLARACDQLDVARATLSERQKIYNLTRERVAAGLGAQVELKQAEAALPAIREEIVALDESAALTRSQLAALLGAGPDRGLAITRPQLAQETNEVVLPSRLPADLLGRRPDVVASRWRVEAAAGDTAVARARFYPDVDLLAFIGFQSLGLDHFLQFGSGVAGIGPALHLPIFDGGRLRAELAGADADYDLAVDHYNETLVQALRDIGEQITATRSISEQSHLQQQALAAASDAYRLALQRYRDGVDGYLSVLSAEGQMLAQRRIGVDLHARAVAIRIGLIRALGGGFAESPGPRDARAGGPPPANRDGEMS